MNPMNQMNQLNQEEIEEGEINQGNELDLEETEEEIVNQVQRNTRSMTIGAAPLANNIWERSQLLSFLKFCGDAGKLTFSMPPANKNKKFLGIKRKPEYEKGYTSAGKVNREEKEACKFLKKIIDPREALPWRDEGIQLWNNDLPYLKRQAIKCRWAQNLGAPLFSQISPRDFSERANRTRRYEGKQIADNIRNEEIGDNLKIKVRNFNRFLKNLINKRGIIEGGKGERYPARNKELLEYEFKEWIRQEGKLAELRGNLTILRDALMGFAGNNRELQDNAELLIRNIASNLDMWEGWGVSPFHYWSQDDIDLLFSKHWPSTKWTMREWWQHYGPAKEKFMEMYRPQPDDLWL